MKVVMRTGDYTIYRKRNQRYAVRNRNKQWVRGEDKTAVLLAHNLIEAPVPKAPDHPEPPPTEAAETTRAGEAAEGGGEEQPG